MTTTPIVRATMTAINPEQAAICFQIALATEKGFTSTLQRKGTSVLVVGSDGQAVKFVPVTDVAVPKARLRRDH